MDSSCPDRHLCKDRLGAYECKIKPGSLLAEIYGTKSVSERHRHRFEANPKYRADFEKNELLVSGESNGLIEVVEFKKHPFFIGVQFHPEFSSHLLRPNAVIYAFCKAALNLSGKKFGTKKDKKIALNLSEKKDKKLASNLSEKNPKKSKISITKSSKKGVKNVK